MLYIHYNLGYKSRILKYNEKYLKGRRKKLHVTGICFKPSVHFFLNIYILFKYRFKYYELH